MQLYIKYPIDFLIKTKRFKNTLEFGKKMKLDLFDKKIVYELEKDSSQSISKIAKKIKRSKEFVNFRIRRLEKEKIILGYSAIVDMSRLGYFTFRIYLKWQNMTEEQKQEFYNKIKVKENVWTTTVLHGKWDFAFFMGVKSTAKFHEIWTISSGHESLNFTGPLKLTAGEAFNIMLDSTDTDWSILVTYYIEG